MTSPRGESPIGTSKLSLPTPSPRYKILLVFGTRPEAIKLCPLVKILHSEPFCRSLEPVICVTGQHREMLNQVLETFGVQPDFDLQLMQKGQSLPDLSSRLLSALPAVFEEVRPSLTVVQGDTTTTFCGALMSFYAGVPVAHVEAGLRTYQPRVPFPEEMNRVLTTSLATLHFAATAGAAGNLLREGVRREFVEVTGNTGIDAVLWVRDRLRQGEATGFDLPFDRNKKLILITAHRRESFGQEFENVCQAVARLAEREDVQIVWPVHPNPQVSGPVERILKEQRNVTLLQPLEYAPFVDLMGGAHLLLTDSGGVQEEAPSLGKPVLVLRDTTERPEAVAAGTVKLVGTQPERILGETVRLLEHPEEYERMAQSHNPYGDGHACARIAARIALHVGIPLP